MSGDRHPAVLERVLLLRTFAPFADLAPEHLAGMAELAEERYFSAGAEIHPEGVPVRHIHYVLSGEVEIRRAGQVVRTLTGRSVVGGLAALAQIRNANQVVARTATTTLSFSDEDQADIFHDNFEIMSRVMRGVARAYLEARRAAGPNAGFAPAEEGALPPHGPLGLVDKLAFLRRTNPYNEARLEAVAELARDSKELRLAAGDQLWRTGDPSGAGLVIVAGVVTGRADEGRQTFRFTTGSIVGGLDSLAAVPRWFDAAAETDVVAIDIEYGALMDLLEDHTEMAMDLLRVLAGGVLALRERNAAAAAA